MNKTELDRYLREEIAAFPGQTSLLAARLEDGEVLWSWQPGAPAVSASTIKVPILLAALELVRQGRLSLEQSIPVPESEILEDTEVFERGQAGYSLWELLYWMIVESDNTATNRVLDTVGFQAVNDYAARVLGLKDTVCQRKMLDWAAIQAGRNNFTSLSDQYRMYRLLCRGELLDGYLTAVAMDFLRRQRSMDCILRYIPQRVDFAHKTGGLDHLCHDAGVFLQEDGGWFLGIFSWDGPSMDGEKGQKMYLGRLAKAIYDTYH